MPSIAAHLASAKVIAQEFKITSPDFLLGAILPDIIANPDSHHKIQGTYFFIPDINFFLNNLDLSKDLYKGYLAHLLLDKYFLEEFVPKKINNFQNVFISGAIYADYNCISSDLLNYFQIDREKVKRLIENSPFTLDPKKKLDNLAYLENKTSAKTTIIDYNNFIEFIKSVSIKIGRMILDDQHNYMSVRFRQCRKFEQKENR